MRLRGAGDPERRAQAELAMHALVANVEGPLLARSLSPATIAEESAQATGSTMVRLMVVAAGHGDRQVRYGTAHSVGVAVSAGRGDLPPIVVPVVQ